MRKDDRETMDKILEALDAGDLALLMDDAKDLLEEITQEGGAAALAQIGFTADESITNQLNEYALDYAKGRSAEMVGKRWVDGDLVDNPDAEWIIADSTRDMLRADIAQAIEDGTSNDDLASELADNYAFSDERAETVARTETAFADVAGNLNAYRESGQVASKRWLTAPECCDECLALDGEVVDLDEDFPEDGGDGPPLHPNCFSGDAVVSASGVTAYFKRWFEGEVTIISAAGIADLTVTPNHAILTARGWVKASELQVGDGLLQSLDPAAALTRINPDYDYVESRFDQIAGTALMTRGMSTRAVPVSAEHFHGDGIADTKVDVVRPACALRLNRSEPQKRVAHCALCGREISEPEDHLTATRGSGERLSAATQSAHRIVRRAGQLGALCFGSLGHPQQHALAAVPHFQSHALPAVAQGRAMATDAPGYINARLAGHVSIVKVTGLRSAEYCGHVYNLETESGWYFANGIVAHNCRCDVLPVLTDEAITDQEGE